MLLKNEEASQWGRAQLLEACRHVLGRVWVCTHTSSTPSCSRGFFALFCDLSAPSQCALSSLLFRTQPQTRPTGAHPSQGHMVSGARRVPP